MIKFCLASKFTCGVMMTWRDSVGWLTEVVYSFTVVKSVI